MSIDDRFFIETDASFKDIATKILAIMTLQSIDSLSFRETDYGTGIDTKNWSAYVTVFFTPSLEFINKALAISPSIDISFTLNKQNISIARDEIFSILIKLLQVQGGNAAIMHNYSFPILLRRGKTIFLKKDYAFIEKYSKSLNLGSIEFQNLPQL